MKIIECPRDAWQGYHPFIPTELKAEYLNRLLKVGFDTIDFGSFVSHKAMPQVSDTAKLVSLLDLSGTSTKLLAIVANERGAAEACVFDEIKYIGYPFSISETFQLRNTNATIAESLKKIEKLTAICSEKRKELVIYISMGFGNPYGDPWHPDLVLQWVHELESFGIRIFSLSDTVGVAREDDILALFSQLVPEKPHLEFGAHFHVLPTDWKPKLDAAYAGGCRRYDGAILGYGGCPMAQDTLVGNMPTEHLLNFSKEHGEHIYVNDLAFGEAWLLFQQLVGA